MRIQKQTLEELQSMGIVAKIYPDDYDSFLQRCYEKSYKWLGMYDDAIQLVDGKMVKSIDLPDYETKKQENAWKYAKRDASNWYDADTLYIEYGDKLICKKENIKSKLITKDYILKLVEKDKKLYQGFYGDFTLKMKSILKEQGISNYLNVYPTTYGIGVMVFWWHGDSWINKVRDILDSKGIEYYNEYSDARWVYRFKVSKKQSNLLKIN